MLPLGGEGDESGAVVGVVSGFDLGEHEAGFVGHDLPGYVDEVVLVGGGGAEGGGDLEELGEGGVEGGEGIVRAVGSPGAGVGGGEVGLGVEEGVLGSVGVVGNEGGAVSGAVGVGGVEEDLPGSLGVGVGCSVAAEGVVVGPGGEVYGVFVPGHFGVEVEGEGVGVEAFGEEGGAGDVGAGEFGHVGEADGVVVERGSEGGAAAKLPEAAVEPGSVVELLIAVVAGDAALFDVGDEEVVGVECVDEGGEGVVLPGHEEPGGVGVGGEEGGLDEAGGGAYGDVAGGSSLLKDFHVVEGGVAEEVVLVAVEAGGESGEVGVAGVDPAGAGEAVPVALSDDVGSGVERGEVCGDDAVVAGEDGGDAEGAEHGDEVLGGGGAFVEEVEGDGFDEAAHVAHELPVLVGGLGDPVADGEVGVAGVAEGLVEDEVGSSLDEDGVGSGEGEDVDFALPAGVGPVGRGVAVDVFVEGVAGLVDRGLGDGSGGRGEDEVGGA